MIALRKTAIGPRYAWLLTGGLLVGVSQGHRALPLAAWLAPLLILRFVRTERVGRALPAFIVVHTLAWELVYQGTVPLPLAARLGVFGGLSLGLGGVFLADRFAAKRSGRFVWTLILPCGWAAFDFAVAALSPTGSWGSIAYTFHDTLPLLQLVSVTGWTGLTFLVGWFAAVGNWAWERGLKREGTLRGVATFAGVLAGVLLLGAWRLSDPAPPSGSVRVAAIVGPTVFESEHVDLLHVYHFGGEVDAADLETIRREMGGLRDRFFQLVEREAQAGAEIVVWAEANAWATPEDMEEWLRRARELAARESIYLAMGMAVFPRALGQPYENKLILFGPDGRRQWEFLKARPVPGAWHVRGDGVLPLSETPYGRLSAAICFDLDFPRLLAQAGKQQVDLLLAPSFDDRLVRWMHARMALLRAVEQGFHLIRPAAGGISMVADNRGRVLASLDTLSTDDPVLVSRVPVRGQHTFYARIGDTFSWACLAGFLGLLVVAVQAKRVAARTTLQNREEQT